MGRTTEEWFENLAEDLRFGLSIVYKTKDPLVIEDKYQELKKNFQNRIYTSLRTEI